MMLSGDLYAQWLNNSNEIKGRVICEEDSLPVPYAQLASYSQKLLYAADSSGYFYCTFPENDSIKVFAMGYEPRIFRISELYKGSDSVNVIAMPRIYYMLGSVDINRKNPGDYTKDDIKMYIPPEFSRAGPNPVPAHLRCDFREKPSPLVLLVSPVSYVRYFVSKTERSKRRQVKMLQQESIRSKLRVEIVIGVSGYTGKELDDFMVYCNTNITLTLHDDEESVKRKVILLFNEYLKSGNEKKLYSHTRLNNHC